MSLLSMFDLDQNVVVGIVIAVVVVLVAVLMLTRYFWGKKRVVNQKPTQTQQADAQQPTYTLEEAKKVIEVMRHGEYLVLARNVTYTVGSDGHIAEGVYIIMSAVANQTKFNIRYNGLVQEVTDGTSITLGAGDTICCVSGGAKLQLA